MMFCGWPKCKHQMAPCRVSYGRVASSHGHGRMRRPRFVLVCRRRARRGSSKRWRPKANPNFARSPDSWMCRRRQSDQGRPSCQLSWSSCAHRSGSKSGKFCWCLFCCADCCQEPSSSAASPTPVSRLGRSRCLALLFLMMFCGWPKCKRQMAPCRVSYERVASSHGHGRMRQSLSWPRFVQVCRRRARRGSSKRWRPKLKPHFAHSPDSWMCANGSQAAT